MGSLRGTEVYYQKFIELQEKLRKSEEERLKLETKFNEMVQCTREEEQAHYRKLRHQYKRFLEEDRRRQERNDEILRALERVEGRASSLAAKTERYKCLQKHYHDFIARMQHSKAKKETESDEARMKFNRDVRTSPNIQRDSAENPIMEKYFQSFDSTERQRDITQNINQGYRYPISNNYSNKHIADLNNFSEGNRAISVSDEIMESIYCKKQVFKNSPTSDGRRFEEEYLRSSIDRYKPELPKRLIDDGLHLYGNENANTPRDLKQRFPHHVQFTDYDEEESKISSLSRFPQDYKEVEQKLNPVEDKSNCLTEKRIGLPEYTHPVTDKIYKKDNIKIVGDNTELKIANEQPPKELQEEFLENGSTLHKIEDDEGKTREESKTPTLQQNTFLKDDAVNDIKTEENEKSAEESPLKEKNEQQLQVANSEENSNFVQIEETSDACQIVSEEYNKEDAQRETKDFDTEQEQEVQHLEQSNYDQKVSEHLEETQEYGQNGEQYNNENEQHNNEIQTVEQNDENNQYFQEYDENGQPLQQYYNESLAYDQQNGQMYPENNGQEAQQYYDENGQYFQQYDGNNQQYYDENGQPLQEYDDNQQYGEYGQDDQAVCDENGELVQQQQQNVPYQQYQENSQLTQQAYNGNHDSENILYDQQYDENGQLIQQSYNENNQQYYEYDENGQGLESFQQECAMESTQEAVIEDSTEVAEQKSFIENREEVAKKAGFPSKEEDVNVVDEQSDNIKAVKDDQKPHKVMDMLDTDTENSQHDTKESHDSDFDFSTSQK